MPLPSTSRWCLLPVRPRSTGLGPVLAPPFSLADGWSRRSLAPTRAARRRAARPAATRAASARRRPAATLAAAAKRSSRSRSRAPVAGAPSRSPCATQTRSPAAPAGHQAACDPDGGNAAAAPATTARSAPTTRPAPPTASPSSTPSRTLTTGADGLRYRRTGPFIELEVLRDDERRRHPHVAGRGRGLEHDRGVDHVGQLKPRVVETELEPPRGALAGERPTETGRRDACPPSAEDVDRRDEQGSEPPAGQELDGPVSPQPWPEIRRLECPAPRLESLVLVDGQKLFRFHSVDDDRLVAEGRSA